MDILKFIKTKKVVPKLVFLDYFGQISEFELSKMDSLTHFLSKNVYNDVLCINLSKVTALNVFLQPQRLHLLKAYSQFDQFKGILKCIN